MLIEIGKPVEDEAWGRKNR